MKKLNQLLTLVALLIVISGCTKQYTINDIVEQKDISITRIEERTIGMTFNKVYIPEKIGEVKNFEKDEILAFRTESSHIYLESVQYNEDNPEYLIFTFNMSYILENKGYVTVPYHPNSDNEIEYTAKLVSNSLDDGFKLYEDALYLHGNGSNEQFAIAIKKDVYELTNTIVSFTMSGFYDLTYVEK